MKESTQAERLLGITSLPVKVSLPQLSVSRTIDADYVNTIANHPDVLPFVSLPGQDEIDIAPIVENLGNYVWKSENGVFICHRLDAGLFEIHTLFLREGHGVEVRRAAKDAMWAMFTSTPCTRLVTKVPVNNKPAKKLAEQMGLRFEFMREKAWSGDVNCEYFGLSYDRWATTNEFSVSLGEWFHKTLDNWAAARDLEGFPNHEDDEVHDRYVGLSAAMLAQGQIAKGIIFYNRWAVFAGYVQIALLQENPVLINVRDFILKIEGKTMEILQCQ